MRTIVLSALVVVALGAAHPRTDNAANPGLDTGPSQLPVPRLEDGACIPALNVRERVDCRTLVVWQNRALRSGTLIRIPVTTYRSRATTPLPDPVLWMAGGPGASAGRRRAQDIQFLDNRDFVVLEQRGTAHTQPALDCAEFTALKRRLNRGLLLDTAEAGRVWLQAGDACATHLRAAGVDLAMYNSQAIADDIEDLRVLLGRPKLNLYGESYSTRVMLTFMREHPDAVRSVVLDSPMPLESRYDETVAAHFIRAMNVIVDGCLAAPQCAASRPQLRDNLREAFRRFARQPAWIALDSARSDSVRVGAAQLVDAFASATRNPGSARVIPALLARAAAGNVAALAPLFAESVGPSSYTWGMRITVWCAEVVPFEDRRRIAAQRDTSLGLGGSDLAVVPPEVCDRMRITPAPARDGISFRSDTPTLILSGELDPYVPPTWGRMLLPNIPHAQLVEIAGRSHTPGFSPCSATIIARFVDDPGKAAFDPCAVRDAGILFAK